MEMLEMESSVATTPQGNVHGILSCGMPLECVNSEL